MAEKEEKAGVRKAGKAFGGAKVGSLGNGGAAAENMQTAGAKAGVEIYRTQEGEVVFNVDASGETIWATQAQMAEVFGVKHPAIVKHLRNIFESGELEEGGCCSKMEYVVPDGRVYQVKIYNLDAIISVGYRVNSRKATEFRKWATGVLRRYVTTGVAVNERRLKELDAERLHEVEGMMGVVRRLVARNALSAGEANGVLEVISRYAGSFEALEEFDAGRVTFSQGRRARRSLSYEECLGFIGELRVSLGAGELFGKERNQSFAGNLRAIEQKFDGVELYKTVAEKAANLLYFIIKDHPFYDGNKRIGSLLFIIYLTMNDYHLTKDGETKISDRAMVALALLIAESEPGEKELIVGLVCKLLD